MTALSPEPVCCTWRFQPGVGTNESIENPGGHVKTILVVVAPSFSVGTASENNWPAVASATGGLMCACANADEATTRAAVARDASTHKGAFMFSSFLESLSDRQKRSDRRPARGRRRPDARRARPGGRAEDRNPAAQGGQTRGEQSDEAAS